VTIQTGGRAPYAPTKTVLRVVERHREFGLRTMDLPKLKSIGVTDALAPRTLASLVGLGFYDDTGQITPEFEALRVSPEADFKPQLGELLRKAYSPVFEILNPATATRTEIEDAFRSFEPPGMRPRMVQLFEGLMIFAGLRPEGQRAGGGTGWASKPAAKSPGGKAATGRPASRTPAPRQEQEPDHGPPPPADSPAGSVDHMKRAYFDLLIEKAKQADSDDGLLDRIERLVGLEPPDKKEDRDRKTAGSTPATPTGPASQGEG
jgi:hypothetical protein